MNCNKNHMEMLELIAFCDLEINGLYDSMETEIANARTKYAMLKKVQYDKRSKAIEAISNFWNVVFANHHRLGSFFDKDLLDFLLRINVDVFNSVKLDYYRIDFYFKENPYFENSVLTKYFQLKDSVPDYISLKQVLIKWKAHVSLNSFMLPAEENKVNFISWYVSPKERYITDILINDIWVDPVHYYTLYETAPVW
ncbi:hypothetical protein FQA39_LY16787 [Lamprigera yunnana]|nr:hypothetical protein FQA39_LY16787 [Lamprigera yunnana]